MKNHINTPYYVITLGSIVLLKLWYRVAENHDLLFLLQPTDFLVGLMTGSHSTYDSEYGYFYGQLQIMIDKSCSGFNFWLIAFFLFTFLMLKYTSIRFQKNLALLISLLLAYLLTLFVNSSRIFASIIVRLQTKNIFPNQQDILHESVGIITNLTFLILAYLLLEKAFLNKKNYAKYF